MERNGSAVRCGWRVGGKQAPVVHGASKQLKWTLGICNCPGAASPGPASAGQTLLNGEEGGPAYKYSARPPFVCTDLQQQHKHQLLMVRWDLHRVSKSKGVFSPLK